MITRLYLEKFFSSVECDNFGALTYVEVFKNPTFSEIKEGGKHCRGVISKDGDFYVGASSGAYDFIHLDLIKILVLKNVVKNINIANIRSFENHINDFLAVILYGDTFFVSESYNPYKMDDISKKIDIHLKKVRKNNPKIKFDGRHISVMYRLGK